MGTIRHLLHLVLHFDDLLTAELRDFAELINVLNMSKTAGLSRVLLRFNYSCQDMFYDLKGPIPSLKKFR